MLATTPAGTNVANTLYTHATPAPTVTRISGIGHHAWRHFGGDHRHYPTGAKAATVGATAAVTVVVVNATRFHGGRYQPDLGDDDRAAAVTIFDTKQTRARPWQSAPLAAGTTTSPSMIADPRRYAKRHWRPS